MILTDAEHHSHEEIQDEESYEAMPYDPFLGAMERFRGIDDYSLKFNFPDNETFAQYLAELSPTLRAGQGPARLMDLGSGYGQFVNQFGEYASKYFIVEGVDAFVRGFEYEGAEIPHPPQTRVLRIEELDYPDEYFDCHISCCCFGYYTKDGQTLFQQFKQVHRTLMTGGGLMVIETPVTPVETLEDLAGITATSPFRIRMDETTPDLVTEVPFIQIAQRFGFELIDLRLSEGHTEETPVVLTFVKK